MLIRNFWISNHFDENCYQQLNCYITNSLVCFQPKQFYKRTTEYRPTICIDPLHKNTSHWIVRTWNIQIEHFHPLARCCTCVTKRPMLISSFNRIQLKLKLFQLTKCIWRRQARNFVCYLINMMKSMGRLTENVTSRWLMLQRVHSRNF